MTSLRTGVIVCCFLSFFVRGEKSQAETKCAADQTNPRHIELCHDQPATRSPGPFKCKSPNDGFVLAGLKIAPRSKHADCGAFHTMDFLDPECLRKVVANADQFDAEVFDVLDKVSGKNEFDSNTVVSRFSWTERKEEEEQFKDSSAFVSFWNLCKSARPAQTSNDDKQVVRMCTTDHVTQSIAILTLQGLDPGHVSEGLSRCRCTITPIHSVSITAFDVRLQHNRTCLPGVSLKMYATDKGQTFHDLHCQGLSALYGLKEIVNTDHKVTLDLTVSSGVFPDSVWLQVSSKKEGSSSSDPMRVECEGITPLNQGPGDGTDPPTPDDDSGADMGMIVGIVVGVIALIGISVIAVYVIKKRMQRSDKMEDMDAEESGDHYEELPQTAADTSTYTKPEKGAPTPPPNHPSFRSKNTPVSSSLLKKPVSEKTAPSSSLGNANNTQANVKPQNPGQQANPVSKPPRNFTSELGSLKKKKSSSVSEDEYNHLMRAGVDAERNSSNNRSQNRYHHLSLGDNGAEIQPLQPTSEKV